MEKTTTKSGLPMTQHSSSNFVLAIPLALATPRSHKLMVLLTPKSSASAADDQLCGSRLRASQKPPSIAGSENDAVGKTGVP